MFNKRLIKTSVWIKSEKKEKKGDGGSGKMSHDSFNAKEKNSILFYFFIIRIMSFMSHKYTYILTDDRISFHLHTKPGEYALK